MEIPDEVWKTANLGLADFFACAMAGADAPVSKNVLGYLKNSNLMQEGNAVLIGTCLKSQTPAASLFNGASSHSMDYDDVSWATIGHPSVSVAPTCLAAAQLSGWTGKQLLRAYILSVEAMHQIARNTMPEVSERGWHTTLAYGVFGAATAEGLRLGLDEKTLTNALGIAASRASGVRANFGSQTKALHAGLANQTGIECARLAACGVTAQANAIEGQDGFAQCFAQKSSAMVFDMGEFWDLKENGLVIKQYPCCSGSHPTNDILDDFLMIRSLNPEDIEEITAGVSLLGPKELTCHLPQNAIQAKFSLEFAIASRLLHGRLKLSSFNDERVCDPVTQALMKKITMQVDPELAKLGFIGTAPVRLSIRMKNGQVFLLTNDLARGNPEKPLSEKLFKEKFLDCCADKVSLGTALDWFEILTSLEKQPAQALAKIGGLPGLH